MVVLVVSEDFKHCLLVHDFASERIHETDIVVHICADERVRVVIAREEFVNDYPFVNEIDAKRAASKLPLLILEVARRTDDRGNQIRFHKSFLFSIADYDRGPKCTPHGLAFTLQKLRYRK